MSSQHAEQTQQRHRRHPEWLKVRLPSGAGYQETLATAREYKLNTVCEDARCPNIAECWGNKTATFMILGDTCTRSCGFCSVNSGKPSGLDTNEPKRTAEAIARLNIKHAVITSVDRDDLPDGGAQIFADTVREIRVRAPHTTIELLTPDFQGSLHDLQTVWNAAPDVFGHNIETIERLYPRVRPGHTYERTLNVLKQCKERYPLIKTKTNIMLGHGETLDEIHALMDDLVQVKLDGLTITQYLQPAKRNLPVRHYYEPERFEELKETARSKGIRFIQSGPLVRSSYRAEDVFKEEQI